MTEPKDSGSQPLDVDKSLKVITGSAVLLTACGYVVQSLHEAAFGYVSPNPFRPKVVAAGVLFLVFLGIPWALGMAVSRMRLPARETGISLLPLRLSGLVLGMLVTVAILSPFTAMKYHEGGFSGAAFVVCFIGFTVGHALSVAPIPDTSLKLLAAVRGAEDAVFLGSAGAALLSYVAAMHEATEDVFWWVLAVAAGSFLVAVLKQTSQALPRGSFEWLLLPPILLTTFSTHVYPRISNGWGGGSPMRVEILFNKDSFSPGLRVQRFLIEETEAGFYLSDSPTGKSQFVPRAGVGLLTFLKDRETSSL